VLIQSVETAADASTGSPPTGELRGALARLGEFMAKYPNTKTHTPTDPNSLPWSSPKPVTRAPYTSAAQFRTSRLFGEPVKVAAGSQPLRYQSSYYDPSLAPTTADLLATEDVQITQAIRDLAASLNNQPVGSTTGARNNIQFIPSYGSIQGSDMTLANQARQRV